MNILRSTFLRLFSGKIQATGPSLTLIRLCTSRHLQDLQQIAGVAFVLYLIFVATLVRFHVEWKDTILSISGLTSVIIALLSWAYQTGSRRIGIVDLFANEIAVICRVCLIVDFAHNSVRLSAPAPQATSSKDLLQRNINDERTKFVSQEQYTPIYDRNVSDLQPFDVDVVTSVTRFYTYRKTMVDYLRMLAIYEGAIFDAVKKQMIYMQYLMYESAREALTLLVEFEPNQADNLIDVLCSEFVLFSFLNQNYRDDFRSDRLKLRIGEYDAIMRNIKDLMQENKDRKNWEKARVTYPELNRRYAAMCAQLNIAFMPDV